MKVKFVMYQTEPVSSTSRPYAAVLSSESQWVQ